MKTLMKTAMMAPVAASLTLAVMMAVSAPASAQAQLANGPEGMQPNPARTGGVTPVRYAGAGEKAAEVDEGWAMAVPVDHSGPIFVVANGDPTISPLSLIGQPLGAIGTFAQTPFKVIGATGL